MTCAPSRASWPRSTSSRRRSSRPWPRCSRPTRRSRPAWRRSAATSPSSRAPPGRHGPAAPPPGMGFLDILTGRRKLAQPAEDRLFAITTAYVTIRDGAGDHHARRRCDRLPVAGDGGLHHDRARHGGGGPRHRVRQRHDRRDSRPTATGSAGWCCTVETSTTSWSASTRCRARCRTAATASGCCARCSRSRTPSSAAAVLDLQLQARRRSIRSSRRGRSSATTSASWCSRRRPGQRTADRARAQPVVPVVGDPRSDRRKARIRAGRCDTDPACRCARLPTPAHCALSRA